MVKKHSRRNTSGVPVGATSVRGQILSVSRQRGAENAVVGDAGAKASTCGEVFVQTSLNRSQFTFCLIYIANGFNATAAYKEAYPAASRRSARELGYRMLTKVDIRVFLATHMTDAWKALQMSGDEALARVAMAARADIRLLFDDEGNLLSPHRWPDEIAYSVEAFHSGGIGRWGVRLGDKLTALRMILEQTGYMRQSGDDVDALTAAIRADQGRSSKPLTDEVRNRPARARGALKKSRGKPR